MKSKKRKIDDPLNNLLSTLTKQKQQNDILLQFSKIRKYLSHRELNLEIEQLKTLVLFFFIKLNF